MVKNKLPSEATIIGHDLSKNKAVFTRKSNGLYSTKEFKLWKG